jgi:hypothetical protein
MTVMMMTIVATMRTLPLPLPLPSHAMRTVVPVVAKRAISLWQMPAALRVTMATHVLMKKTKMGLPESSLCATTWVATTLTVTLVLPMTMKKKVLLRWRQQMMVHHQRNKRQAL